MSAWLAPAKVNLTLMVRPRASNGLHPLRSLMQTLDWCDRLEFSPSGEDRLRIEGADLPTGGENLVWKAAAALEEETGLVRPPLEILLRKRIPVAAGLGGGSADAAAVLLALAGMFDIDYATLRRVAPRIGSDVPAALVGGTLWVEGFGERVSEGPRLSGFAVAAAVVDFPLLTADVYRMWDDLDGPAGPRFPSGALPPVLRGDEAFRNDLQPAALAVRPELGDAMDLLAREWGRPVALSGSGPALFGYFVDEEEAVSAAGQVRGVFGAAVGAGLFPAGPGEIPG